MNRARMVGLALAVLLSSACAHVPAAAPACEINAGAVYALVTRVLSDGCTKRNADEFLIAHTDFLMKACHGSVTDCVRKVCVKLGEEDEAPDRDGPGLVLR